jgi:hypothetical protein
MMREKSWSIKNEETKTVAEMHLQKNWIAHT